MKKVLAVLVVAGVVCASTTAMADIVNTSLGKIVTCSAVADPVNRDAEGWTGTYNNHKGINPSGGTHGGANWGTGGNSDEGLVALSRSEIQGQITAAGANWDAYYVIPLVSWDAFSNAPVPVVGIFKTDQVQPAPGLFKPDLDWTASSVSATQANALGVNDITTGQPAKRWIAGGAAYSTFENMVRATGEWNTYPVSAKPTYNAGTGAFDSTTKTSDIGDGYTVIVHIGQQLVNDYLNNTAYTGFFFSDAETGGEIYGYGGTQWGSGSGCQSLLITPEPATLCLLVMGGLALLRRRHA